MSSGGLLHRLGAPYRACRPLAERWGFSAAIAIFVFVFLFVFRPFGLSNYGGNVLLLTLGYGACTFVASIILNILMPYAAPGFFAESRWTVGREILWNLVNLLLITALNVAYSVALGIAAASLMTLISFFGFTLAVGIFPIAAAVSWNAWRLERRNRQLSADMQQEMREIRPTRAPATNLVFRSQNPRDNLEISPADLLYCAGADNYVEIYYLSNGQVKRHLIRNTLKSVLEDGSSHGSLLRCHKSYLVNLGQVSHVTGNAQGCRLQLKAGDISVPASRLMRQELRDRLAVRP